MTETKHQISLKDWLKVVGLGIGGTALLSSPWWWKLLSDNSQPDPEAVATRVAQLRAEKTAAIFQTPETGIYNREALARWQELEPQPKLAGNLGITILPSKYVRGNGTIDWHREVAVRLGFQRVSIPISPPEFRQHTGIDTGGVLTLNQMINRRDYQAVFMDPRIKGIHVTCDVGGPGCNGWGFPQGNCADQNRLRQTYEEYRQFCHIILENAGHLGKCIIISGPNELDLLAKGGYSQATEDADIPETARLDAIRYLNAVHQAVRDANAAYPGKTPLQTGAEVLQVRALFNNPERRMAINSILPYLDFPPDEVGLSAWQVAGKGIKGYLTGAAVRLMQGYMPSSQIAITEYGIADRDRPDLDRQRVADEYGYGVLAALEAGATRIDFWGLTDYDADVENPNNDQTRGLGLIRPDGSIRLEVYNQLRTLSGIETV